MKKRHQMAEPFSREAIRAISQFRGLPDPSSRARMRQPAEIGSLVHVLFEHYGIEKPSLEKELMSQWRSIVGENLAHRCSPQRILDGRILVIAVGNATLRQELLFKQRKMLQSIRKIPGGEAIEELKIISG